ncbi:acyl carrier protein [Micromonospora profundi]|uniref:acyl carrier protein n=1 Tax=Micromonospora profundi TaxID=1420889 RepID=UPI003664DA25
MSDDVRTDGIPRPPAAEPDTGACSGSTAPSPRPVLTAEQIAALCSDIAGTPIGADDDIFLAGLSSLDLVRLTGAVQQAVGVRLTALDVLDHPTSRELAALLPTRPQAAGHE